MAETSKGKKWVHVDGYKRGGTTVRPHDRSTPKDSKGPQKGKGGK